MEKFDLKRFIAVVPERTLAAESYIAISVVI